MKSGIRVAACVAAATLGVALADDAPKSQLTTVPADPKAVALIQELAFPEAPSALREQKGWKKPRRIVLSASGPYNPSDPKTLAAWQAVNDDVEEAPEEQPERHTEPHPEPGRQVENGHAPEPTPTRSGGDRARRSARGPPNRRSRPRAFR